MQKALSSFYKDNKHKIKSLSIDMSDLTPQNLTHAYQKERFLYITLHYCYSLTYLFSLTNSEQTKKKLFFLSFTR